MKSHGISWYDCWRFDQLSFNSDTPAVFLLRDNRKGEDLGLSWSDALTRRELLARRHSVTSQTSWKNQYHHFENLKTPNCCAISIATCHVLKTYGWNSGMKICAHKSGTILLTFLWNLHLKNREMESQNGKQKISFVVTAFRKQKKKTKKVFNFP